jgi:hypothetical protein
MYTGTPLFNLSKDLRMNGWPRYDFLEVRVCNTMGWKCCLMKTIKETIVH